MDILLIEYSVRSEIASRILQFFSKLIGAKTRKEYVPTEEEQEAITKSLNSVVRTDIENLQAYLKSQYES